MKLLIIGAKGFLGSHCVSFFSKQYDVWQCDVVVDYNTPNYFLIDATNASYNDLFKSEKFDYCINCSGAASVPDSIKNPIRDFELNTHNVFKQLESIRKYNSSCKYINLSSAAVYGDPIKLPISENQKLAPISPYGIHKKMAEEICMEFYTQFNINTCSLRIFSAYGEGLKKQLFWDLYQKFRSGRKIELFGSGNETRDFIHVSDLTSAIECILNNGKFHGETINVANGEELSISYVVSLFYELIDPKIEFDFIGENRPGDPINWVADINKLNDMGYLPKVDIESGLLKYIKWVKENE